MTSVNALFKEYIVKMPDLLETKKDIGGYEKEFWKANKDKLKELKVKAKADAKAEAKAGAKAGKRKKQVDEDGNVKVRAPTAYNIFVKEYRSIVKEARPELSNKEIFSEIARMWNIKKEGGEILVKEKSEELHEEDEEDEQEEDEDDDQEEDEDDDQEEDEDDDEDDIQKDEEKDGK
jgi:hypothetical protein